MKILRFIFTLLLAGGVVFVLNTKIGDIPPLGKLLDPFQGFWQNSERPGIHVASGAGIPGLEGAVTVRYEDNLIPHIFAANDHDLYFAQGYITARYRLWQMDFLTRVASGRISEIIGGRALQYDRLQRRKGLMYGAENSLKELEKHDDFFAVVKAYTEGVNAYIRTLEYRDYPVEYKILDYKPEAWAPIKNILLLKYMSDDLSGSDDDLENTNAVMLFGKQRFDFLFPSITDENDPVIPAGTRWNFTPTEVTAPENWKITNHFTPKVLQNPEPNLGSNNWAVSGEKTRSGHVILCNDPHLHLTFPSIWFAQQLHSPDLNVYGVTIPGLPGVLLGFNDSIAWGLTNAPRDNRDWYQITFRDNDRNEYLYDGKWLKTHKRVEHIRLRDGTIYNDTVVYTHYGPVVYDRTFLGDSARVNYALKWMAHTGSQEISLLHEIDHAKNVQDMIQATRLFECPPQNIAVATRSGDIAMLVEGKFPMKWKEQGKYLMDGSNPIYEWQGFIPHEQNAIVINPPRGFVSSANQRSFDDTYPYYYYNNTEEHFRNRRINSLLSEMNDITPQDMMKMQNDTYSVLASEVLPVMLDTIQHDDHDSTQNNMITELSKWNYYYDPNMTAPSYFHTWFYFMEQLTWDEFEGDTPLPWPDEYQLSWMLRRYPSDSIFDIKKTKKYETFVDIIRQSFTLAADSLGRWEKAHGERPVWYRFKNTRVSHLVPQFRAFSQFDIPVGGYKHIINAASRTEGPSWRLVAELGDTIRAWGIYPGGQSGNPGSPYYKTFLNDWANGKYFRIKYMKNEEDTLGMEGGRTVIMKSGE